VLTAEQKALRREGIGGSDIAALVGVDSFRTPLDVAISKLDGYEPEAAPWLERGTFLEAGIADWYAFRTGSVLKELGTVTHPSEPIALCTPDRIAKKDKWIDLSIKSPGSFSRDDWGEPETDDVPIAYVIQIQWELMILEARGDCDTDHADLAALIDGDLAVYRIAADRELQGELLESARKFWRDFIVPRRYPPLNGSKSSLEWLKRRFPRDSRPIRAATAREELLALELQEAEEALGRAEKRKAVLASCLQDQIGKSEAAGIEGAFGRITWKADKNGNRSFRTRWKK